MEDKDNKKDEIVQTDTTFDHWNTEPVLVKTQAYKPDDYTGVEWQMRQEVERYGDDMFNHSTGIDFKEFDYL